MGMCHIIALNNRYMTQNMGPPRYLASFCDKWLWSVATNLRNKVRVRRKHLNEDQLEGKSGASSRGRSRHAKGERYRNLSIDPVALRGRHQLNRVGGVVVPVAGFEKG